MAAGNGGIQCRNECEPAGFPAGLSVLLSTSQNKVKNLPKNHSECYITAGIGWSAALFGLNYGQWAKSRP